jgi:hypothetical protein
MPKESVYQLITLLLLLIYILIYISEVIFSKNKLFIKYGLIISKKRYKLKYNYFAEKVGEKYLRGDVFFSILKENLCIFESQYIGRISPHIIGYIEIDNDNVIVVYKKPFSSIILFTGFVIWIIMLNKALLVPLIGLPIIIGILFFFNYMRLNSMEYDVEYFINYGK